MSTACLIVSTRKQQTKSSYFYLMATKGLLFMRLPQAVRETHALERKSSSSLMKLQPPSTQLCRNQEVAQNPIRLLASRSLCAKISLKERFQPALNSPCSTKAARCWRVWNRGCNLIFLQALASGSEKTIPIHAPFRLCYGMIHISSAKSSSHPRQACGGR